MGGGQDLAAKELEERIERERVNQAVTDELIDYLLYTGGIRNDLNEGDITKREIYSIDPFNNGSVTYTMTVEEIKNFLIGSHLGIYYSGVIIEQNGNTIDISNLNNQLLEDETSLTVGLNDYIPAVYDTYFTQNPNNKPFTTAETIINYLGHTSNPINYTNISSYFKFQ